jgi:hypothetical protein
MNDASEAGRTLSKLGASRGGIARAKKLTAKRKKQIARKAINARWKKWRESHGVSSS